MKIKVLFFLLLFTISLSSFSQGNDEIILSPDKKEIVTLSLKPDLGAGKSIDLPVELLWNKKANTIDLQLLGNESKRFIYLFPELEYFQKIKKQDKEIWFSKEIRKKSDSKMVERWLGKSENMKLHKDIPDIMKSSLKDNQALGNGQFRFDVQDAKKDNCQLSLRIYIATQENGKWYFLFIPVKSKRDLKIEYKSEIKLNITLLDICAGDELQKIVRTIQKEWESLRNNAIQLRYELGELSDLTCQEIIELTNKSEIEKPESIQKNFMQYSDCENFQTAINNYLGAVDSYNKTVKDYNKELSALKGKSKKCPKGRIGGAGGIGETVKPNCDCNSLSAANSKLRDLYFRMDETGKKADSSSFRSEYKRITAEITGCETCKGYAAYKEWCRGIETILNK